MTTAIGHLIARSPLSAQIFEIVSAFTLVFFAWPFLEGPYRLYTRASRPLLADYRVLIGEMSPPLPQYRTNDLQALGFEFIGYLAHEPGIRNTASRLAMFVHRENGDSAQLANVVSGLRTIPMLIFKTRFDDGFAFETSNTATPQIFTPDQNFPTFRFPAVRSTRSLYRLHCRLKEGFSVSRHPVIAEGTGELWEFISRAEVTHQRHVQGGDYKLAPSKDRYAYTMRGAIRLSWLQAWPVKQIRQIRLENRSMRMAEELGLRIHPVFGCLQEEINEWRAKSDR